MSEIGIKGRVNNVPSYAWDNPIWVCSFDDDGKIWFYGAWKTEMLDTALGVAKQIHGIVITK